MTIGWANEVTVNESDGVRRVYGADDEIGRETLTVPSDDCRSLCLVTFNLLSLDVPLGEEALPLFSEYPDRVTFGIYTRYIDRISPCFASLTANLENMICLGVNGHDADILLQFYSSQTTKWMPHIEAHGIGAGKGFVPNYTAADFMPGRITDGGAMIYTRSKGKFEKSKIFL